ncbi:G-type lectin S-receptor serine/threonine-protein kinase [Trifolium repens]|nr:G-type lectin S-receptor serine/threonine-protein kinase [Trifolium repens]
MQGFFLLFLFITSLSILITIATSTDTLTSSQILTTNQTLESSNGTFVLGFITGTNSNIYLAIWYKNIDPRTVVWVANRDNPLQNNSTNDGFLKISDNGNIVLFNSSLDSNNNLVCSCTGYAKIYDDGGGCVMWFGELVDIRSYSDGGQDLYIRRAYQKLAIDTNGKRNGTAITISTVIVATIIIAVCTYFLWSWASKRSAGSGQTPQENQSASLSGDVKQVKIEDLPLFEFKNISTATNNFSSANKIGEGGFGSVYKGELPDGLEIAVKRLSRTSGQGEEKMLVYEYMPNNSLDFYLFDPIKKKVLDWQKRLYIIEGISRGLLYLHRDSRLRIIHRDLKPSNILLDGELNPKISDFGMARIFGGTENEGNTRRIVGTYGYMSPEYAMKGLFSEKSDVFSFGVLLLEIISGMKNTSFYNHEQEFSLLGYAWKLWNEEEERPTMATVVTMLNSEIVKFPRLCQPGFIQRQIEHRGEPSVNSVTVTSLQGR